MTGRASGSEGQSAWSERLGTELAAGMGGLGGPCVHGGGVCPHPLCLGDPE